MKKIFIILICFISSYTIFTNCSTTNKVEGNNTKKVIFKDNFNDNSNNWETVSDGEFLLEITKGVLHLNKNHLNRIDNGCLWYSKQIKNLNTSDNIKISFDIKFLNFEVYIDKAIDFMWGNDSDLYQLTIDYQGCVQLRRFTSGKGWSDTFISSFYKNDAYAICTYSGKYENFIPRRFNNISIIQKDENCLIYINNKKVVDVKIKKIQGNSIGFQQCVKVEWVLDNLKIEKIK